VRFAEAELLSFDIDGTLTDATTWWAGPDTGWVQRYSVRDGEALLRIRQRRIVVPLSRNRTKAAISRIEGLGLDMRWLGVQDKITGLEQICREYNVAPERVCFVGDGFDDVPVLRRVGLGCAVADAHPAAIEAAAVVLRAKGGERVIEEIEHRMIIDA
jgi:3-deoxy-D-manno-octulosonate 8-phosphate phosphatase (KDO 8-P phosphatase)